MKGFHSLKGGREKVLPCLEGGAQKVSDPQFSHFVAPPLPVSNDQSLKFYPVRLCGRGGGGKKFRTCNFPIL